MATRTTSTRSFKLRVLALTAIVAAVLPSSVALAHQRVSMKLINDSRDSTMTCAVSKVVTNIYDEDIETELKRYTLEPSSSPKNVSLTVRYIAKRIDRSVVYPKIKLTCELDQPNTRNPSPAWDLNEKSPSEHRFKAFCRDGAPCSASVESK